MEPQNPIKMKAEEWPDVLHSLSPSDSNDTEDEGDGLFFICEGEADVQKSEH